MDWGQLLVLALFLFVPAAIFYGRFKHGSWTGSFLGGRIDRTLGEIELSSGFASSTIEVHAMQGKPGEPGFVGLVFIAKAPLGASMNPHKLTKEQATRLAQLLVQAAR